MVSREQQRCQPAYHSKSTPRECLGRLNFLNPLSCYCTARSFTSKRCQKTNPMGLLQCLATKHLSPNAFKWFSRAGKAWVFGREDDPFLSFRTLPQVEAFLAGVSADGRKLRDIKPFGGSLFHGALSAERCFGHFSPINKLGLASALSLQGSRTMFNQRLRTRPVCTQTLVVLVSWVWNPEP